MGCGKAVVPEYFAATALPAFKLFRVVARSPLLKKQAILRVRVKDRHPENQEHQPFHTSIYKIHFYQLIVPAQFKPALSMRQSPGTNPVPVFLYVAGFIIFT